MFMNISPDRAPRYLFFITLSYSYSVLRPIELAIKKRGGEVRWYIPAGSEAEQFLSADEERLMTVKQVKLFNADATLAPGNFIPDFFPGIKVQVFHGLDSGKKGRVVIRGLFDLYCTLGPKATQAFNDIADGTCEIVETGWSKLDPLFLTHPKTVDYQLATPTILYAPTFSPKLKSTEKLFNEIQRLSNLKSWHWYIKLHPKAPQDEVNRYKSLVGDNLTFVETRDIIPLLQASDVILSDTSSVLTEFALQIKPVVTFENREPKDWMMNFSEPQLLESILEQAICGDNTSVEKIKHYSNTIHPYQDGKSSERVLDAIDSLVERGTTHLKAKPLNLVRRFKMRRKLNYMRWS